MDLFGVLQIRVCIIIITLINQKLTKPKMKDFIASETESSQFERLEDRPPLMRFRKALQENLDPEKINSFIKKFASAFKLSGQSEFEEGLKTVAALLQKGYAQEVTKSSEIAITMMKKFNSLCRQIQSDQAAEIRMIYVLSTIAELMKQCPKTNFPLNRKFLQSVFLIDEELLECSPYRKQILAVLGVIYENTSRQAKLLKKLDLVREFKTAVLSNYHIVEESFSARLFNKSLYNLAVQGQSLTEAELHKYGVFQSIVRFMGAEQSQILIQKLKTVLSKINAKPQDKPLIASI